MSFWNYVWHAIKQGVNQIFINFTIPSTLVPVIIPATIIFSKFYKQKYYKIRFYLKNYTGIDYTAALNMDSLFDLQIEIVSV